MQTFAVDGRTVAWEEWGDPAGAPLVYCHGTPSSRRERHPDPEALRGVRMLTFDRPGYGGSTRQPGRNVAGIARLVAALADALGVERFAVLGASGGGPHALACAALLGDRVTRAAAIATPAPVDLPGLDWLGSMNPLNVSEFGAARRGEEALATELRPSLELVRSDPNAFVTSLADVLPAPDRETLSRPDAQAMWRDAFAEGLRESADGWVDDDLAFVRAWGFEPAAIRVETRFVHGELDDLAPRLHGEALARAVPGARFELVRGSGHLVYAAWPPLLEWLAAGGKA